MAKILFTWELGGGLGHFIPYLRLIDKLRKNGHEVAFAVRDTAHAGTLLAARGVHCLQAPIRVRPVMQPISPAFTYADILYNSGFENADALRDRVEAWRGLFNLVRPDLVIFDHSPTALLAARSFSFVKIIGGTGFTTPPDVSPLPNIRELKNNIDPGDLYKRELEVLKTINDVLKQLRLLPLDRITQLFTVDLIALHTFRELDHYADRIGGTYWGCITQSVGAPPMWPDISGKKILAYLKSVPTLPKLLTLLRELAQPTLVYVDGADPTFTKKFESDTLTVSNIPLDMKAAAAQCDYAVHHAGHGTTADLLLAGRPMLLLPITLEQLLLAQRIEQLGAGVAVMRPNISAAHQGLEQLLKNDSSSPAGAQAFAARYSDWNPDVQVERLTGLISDYLAQPGKVESINKVSARTR